MVIRCLIGLSIVDFPLLDFQDEMKKKVGSDMMLGAMGNLTTNLESNFLRRRKQFLDQSIHVNILHWFPILLLGAKRNFKFQLKENKNTL